MHCEDGISNPRNQPLPKRPDIKSGHEFSLWNIYFAEYRRATSAQLTTFHQLPTYSARRF